MDGVSSRSGGVLEADTHPDWPLTLPLDDSERHVGLIAALGVIADMIHRFHEKPNDTIDGARMSQLMRRVPSIRVYVSTGRGRADFQIPYTPDGEKPWRAFVTLHREDWQPETPDIRPTVREAAQ